MMNPCSKCGADAEIIINDSDSRAFMLCCNCGNKALYTAWNDLNQIPEPDAHKEVAELEEKLADLYAFLEDIVPTMQLVDIRIWAKHLLAKHRGN